MTFVLGYIVVSVWKIKMLSTVNSILVFRLQSIIVK